MEINEKPNQSSFLSFLYSTRSLTSCDWKGCCVIIISTSRTLVLILIKDTNIPPDTLLTTNHSLDTTLVAKQG